MTHETDPRRDTTPGSTTPRPQLPAAHARLERALTTRAIVIGALTVLVAAVASLWTLLAIFGSGTDADNARLDAVRTAATIVLGTGGVMALYLAARRQRSTELDLLQKERDLELRDHAQSHVEQVAAYTQARQLQRDEVADQDAASRRVTELYTAAAEQLGHANAPVRLAGLYALERLAQYNPEQRQTIVNVLCAYLRMPFEPPPPLEAFVSEPIDHYDARQEREVRLTAQRILSDHLRKPDPNGEGSHHWPAMEINLAGAHLIDFALDTAAARLARFTKATFDGPASFWLSEFDNLDFEKAVFNDAADFTRMRVRGDADFAKAEFAGRANFDNVSILSVVTFGGSRFDASAIFAGAHLATSSFTDVQFGGYASFDKVTFDIDPRLDGARFAEPPSFSDTTFGAHLAKAEAHGDTEGGAPPDADPTE